LRAEGEYPIPKATQRVARAAFPKGTLRMRLTDRLGSLYREEQFGYGPLKGHGYTVAHPRAKKGQRLSRLAIHNRRANYLRVA
jgi:hypothetical protein